MTQPDTSNEPNLINWLVRSGRLIVGLTFSRLTATIVIANLIGLLILLLGSLGMTQYRDGLIAAKLEGVRGQAQVIADIIAQVAADDIQCQAPNDLENEAGGCRVSLREDYVNAVFNRLWDGFEGRVRVFNAPQDYNDLPVKDARVLLLEDVVLRKDEFEVETLPDIDETETFFPALWEDISQRAVDIWPLDTFREEALQRSLEQELTEAFQSSPDEEQGIIASVRYNENDELVASVSVPIRKVQAVYGVVTAEIGGIQDLVDEARGAVIPIFGLALITAFLSSLLLTAAIALPIRQLSLAADKVREGIAVAGRARIPDLEKRNDEIGELSKSLRAMTRAIYARIEAIESFAADVSHELKNPLTSIRSATETLEIAKTPEAKEKLISVIQKDVVRMDRLITDISNASRLDAELAREMRDVVDLEKLLRDIVDMYSATRKEGQAKVSMDRAALSFVPYMVGSPTALGQVFRNLVDNAMSFSPENGEVRIRYWVEDNEKERQRQFYVTVEDQGPGIPPDNLESIFKRFYTERPAGTAFGNNSGLGLAISRQITESHGGSIWAENITNADGSVSGAKFSVILPMLKGEN